MNADIVKAKEILSSGEFTCVLCKGDIVLTSSVRGIRPLLEWLDQKTNLEGFSSADKIVGKAAALLYVLTRVKEVYAPVMTSAAVEILSRNSIKAYCDTEVKEIINRMKTGICPMERVVLNIDDPTEAFKALKQKISLM